MRVLKVCEKVFTQHNFTVDISSIAGNDKISDNCDIIGFCFPVYAFGLPRIAKEFLNNLPYPKSDTKVFLLVTCGDPDEVGFALTEGIEILKKKNYKVIYSDAIHMPANWITFIDPPSKDKALQILNKSDKKTAETAKNIIENKEFHRPFNFPPRYSKFNFYKEYYSFHKLGIYNMWRMFRTNEKCNSCGLCARVCPTNASLALEHGGEDIGWLTPLVKVL